MDVSIFKHLTAINIQPDNGGDDADGIVSNPIYTLDDMTLYEFNETDDVLGLGIEGSTLSKVFPGYWFQKGKSYVFSKGDKVYTY